MSLTAARLLFEPLHPPTTLYRTCPPVRPHHPSRTRTCTPVVNGSHRVSASVHSRRRRRRRRRARANPTTELCLQISRLENGRERRPSLKNCDTEGKTRARRIDKLSRKIFPLVFLLFNVTYWIVYTVPNLL